MRTSTTPSHSVINVLSEAAPKLAKITWSVPLSMKVDCGIPCIAYGWPCHPARGTNTLPPYKAMMLSDYESWSAGEVARKVVQYQGIMANLPDTQWLATNQVARVRIPAQIYVE